MKMNPQRIGEKLRKERAAILKKHPEYGWSFVSTAENIQFHFEKGHITREEAARAAMTEANETQEKLIECRAKPVDDDYYRLPDELQIYCYAAYLYSKH